MPLNYSQLSREELEALLTRVEEEIEEISFERRLTLGSSGVHLGALEVKRYEAEFAREMREAEDKKAKILEALREKKRLKP